MTEPETPASGDSPVEAPKPAAAWEQAPAAPVPGAAGFVYADVPNRVIALIIDAILLAIITAIVTGIVYGIVGSPVELDIRKGTFGDVNYISLIIGAVISLVLGAVYYIYTWTAMRATPGQKVLGMQVGNFPDGKTLTMDQAMRRWAALFAPASLAQIVYVLPTLGGILGLLIFAYELYLLWTTYKSPTKQGFHDKFANSVVVKAMRTV